jgi:hypothetical protein
LPKLGLPDIVLGPNHTNAALLTGGGVFYLKGGNMIYRCILPNWAADTNSKKVLEGEFSNEQIEAYNTDGYNIYYLPNFPANYDFTRPVDGADIDTFEWVFVDFDLKTKTYASKEEFIAAVKSYPLTPTKIVDSGNGVHVYWKVNDLDVMSYLKLQRRLMRLFKTDEAITKIFQLMRVPGTVNTKDPEDFKMCILLEENAVSYSAEQLNDVLPMLMPEDERFCEEHFNRTYNLEKTALKVDEKLPVKFGKLLDTSKEAKVFWCGNTDDRSKSDYRLGHLMFAHNFTKDEAMSVLVNSSKAMARAPKHRVTYAANIVDKIWTYESTSDKDTLNLSMTVKSILSKGEDAVKGERFPCYRWLDDTAHGFRLGQVIGLVAGSGVGKTAIGLNMFLGFVENNPDCHHFVVPLEQPGNEIADRWRLMCGDREYLHDKVHILSNYDEDGNFRHLSLDEIKDYILKFQKITGYKVGCIMIDHIGALKKKGADGENQGLLDICHSMKAFAVQTNSLLVMQSQSSREKAGIGDLELNKDAAYGTMYFEAYCDYLITLWQPLKRCYKNEKCPTVTAFKFCKIRHKKKGEEDRKSVV